MELVLARSTPFYITGTIPEAALVFVFVFDLRVLLGRRFAVKDATDEAMKRVLPSADVSPTVAIVSTVWVMLVTVLFILVSPQ